MLASATAHDDVRLLGVGGQRREHLVGAAPRGCSAPRRVLIYSGNMFNELPDVPYVITTQ
ncbi:MAG: hypothetical protein ABIZ05_13385 [Pseudonocardiaceae bacterium]